LADLCARLAPVASAVLHARGEARVRVLADGPMAQAHEQYTGIPGPTDVLTFDLSDHDADGPVTGPVTIDADVLVCADEARRQAADLGHDVARELVLYVLHAVLHCCGHDDHDEASFARMHALEDTILTQAGIGATFVPPARPGIGGGS
jgi:probable rRNA maturation factor